MLREEVLNSSRELVSKIYEKMNVIESCDAVAEKIKNLDVCFNDIDNKQIVSLDEILNSKQLIEIREGIISKIYDNAAEAQSFLERLNRKPAIINPEFEAVIQDMVKSTDTPKTKPTGRKIVELDIEKVKDLYINQGLSFRKVADQCGCAENTIRNFVIKNGITRETAAQPEKKPTYPEMTVEVVRKIYTDGTMSLADTAKHFGKTKDQLHNFVKINRIERAIAKPKDPFLDTNKMGKEEFKRKMLSGRK